MIPSMSSSQKKNRISYLVNRISLRNKYRAYSIECLVKEIKDKDWRKYYHKATAKSVKKVAG